MNSNEDSRKRSRDMYEEDSEDTLVNGREEGHGRSPGPMSDVSIGHVDEVMGDDSEAPRRDDNGPSGQNVDDTREGQQDDTSLTGVWLRVVRIPITRPPPLFCDVCHRDGTHSTGQCAMVTSLEHGDTETDPFCNSSCTGAQDRHGNPTHDLQGGQDADAPRIQIVCPDLAAIWNRGALGLVIRTFVVDRRRMAPLAVYTQDLCFVKLAVAYAEFFCHGEVPKELEGMWPYTKADAIKHKTKLRRFYEIGMENMPAGELEGLSIPEIRARYESGAIPPQCRVQDRVAELGMCLTG